MSLRVWRKHSKFAYPGKKWASRKKVSLWHTTCLSVKQKAYYAKKNKWYSSELRTSLSGVQTHIQQWRNAFKEYKMLHWRTLYASSFWVFRNPVAVPGVVQIRRSKSVYGAQRQALRNLSVWLRRIPYCKLFVCQNHENMTHLGTSIHFRVFLLEGYWCSIYTKIGFLQTIGETQIVVKHKGVLVNGKPQNRPFGVPGDVFVMQKAFWLRAPYYKEFHDYVFKSYCIHTQQNV